MGRDTDLCEGLAELHQQARFRWDLGLAAPSLGLQAMAGGAAACRRWGRGVAVGGLGMSEGGYWWAENGWK